MSRSVYKNYVISHTDCCAEFQQKMVQQALVKHIFDMYAGRAKVSRHETGATVNENGSFLF